MIAKSTVSAEALGIVQHALLVIAEQRPGEGLGSIQALARIGSVANHITQTHDFTHAGGGQIGQHRVECFEVAVNIAKYRPFQAAAVPLNQ